MARLHGRMPAHVFDTQIAAGFCGMSYPAGLGRLTESLLDLKLGKGLTFTHWDHRPLSEVHARYAADDVRFLPALRALLETGLSERGHLEWSAQECREQAEAAAQERDTEMLYRKIKGMHQLRPRKLAVLRALVCLREEAAREHDVPARSLIKDSVLLDLARNPADQVEGLSKVPGLPRRIASAYGEAIINATRRGLSAPKEDLPRLPAFTKETPEDQVRIDALNALAANLCHARQIAPSLVFSRRDVGQFYHAHRRGTAEMADCRLMQGWRRELAGEPLVSVMDGRTRVRLSWDDDRMRAEVEDTAGQ